MRERAKELKAAASREEAERQVVEVLAAMPEPDRALGEGIHALVKRAAPELAPRTWYGMPAYADADGKIVCFFQSAEKFKTRYATFGFNASANLDDGAMWPVAFAVTKLGPAEKKRIRALVEQAVRPA